MTYCIVETIKLCQRPIQINLIVAKYAMYSHIYSIVSKRQHDLAVEEVVVGGGEWWKDPTRQPPNPTASMKNENLKANWSKYLGQSGLQCLEASLIISLSRLVYVEV